VLAGGTCRPQAADKKFLDAYKKKFNVDPILYAPFTYDARTC
jgi:hypothetical protein